MKARELRDIICRGDAIRYLDDEIRVVLNQPGMPATPSVGVKSACPGIDWDHGKLLLRTDEPIVSKPKTKRQRANEWAKKEKAMIEQKTKHLRVIASNMRMLNKLKREVNTVESLREIQNHMENVAKELRTP